MTEPKRTGAKPLSLKLCRETAKVYNSVQGNVTKGAEKAGMSTSSFRVRVESTRRQHPEMLKDFSRSTGGHPPLSREVCEQTAAVYNAVRGNYSRGAEQMNMTKPSFRSRVESVRRQYPDLLQNFPVARGGHPKAEMDQERPIADRVRDRLRKGNASLQDLQAITSLGESATLGVIEDLKSGGFNVFRFGDLWSIEKSPPLPGHEEADDLPVLISRPDNTFLIGASGDQHLCSKYQRLDVLNDLYDRFAKAKVQCVYNTGNWIDGEARFNKHDLLVHGMEAQCRYLARNYPQRPGIKTYAVAGDDHEGWYGQREGVDIGRFAERIMREEGREDWVHMGFMEAYVRLVNANTGKYSILAVVHPGGGSAYALSYSIQKIIEALDGGEKPAVGLYGHYHKLWAGNIRNVWVCQTGTTKDQDPFMRKNKIDAHVGGSLIEMEQDPETGAIIGFTPKLMRYFNKGYYAGRWSHSGDVTLPERAA